MANTLCADTLRRDVLKMAKLAGSGHLGGCFSCAEIMAVLYGRILCVDPENPVWADRDRMILSKGHAAPMLYACLAARGFFPREVLWSLRDYGSPLQGHPCMFKLPGVDMSTGSLGLGLSVGVGMSLALRGTRAHVYVLLGDGELQEGQNWEAMMSMRAFQIANLTPIVDLNGVQLDGATAEVQPGQSSLKSKIVGFGLRVFEVDGHDEDNIEHVLNMAKACGTPHIVLAHTVKGKGVTFMEGRSEWHGKPLTEDTYAAACAEIERRMAI